MRWLELQNTTPASEALGFSATNWDTPQFLPLGHTNTQTRMRTAEMGPSEAPIPLPAASAWDLDRLLVVDPLSGRDITLATLLDRRLGCDGLLVFQGDGVRYETYRGAFAETDTHLLHSCSKTLTTMMVGCAIGEGKLHADVPMRDIVPELPAAWQGVTLQHVLDMAAGIASEEHYDEPDGMYWQYAPAVGYYGNPGAGKGVLQFVKDHLTERSSAPGEVFNYASYITNLIPICLERAYDEHPVALYERHLFQRVGAEHPGLVNCDRFDRPVVEGQVSLSLRDFARWALLYLHDGRNLAGEQVLPEVWVREAFAASPGRRAAFERGEQAEVFPGGEYHNQMWLLNPGEGIAAMLGIHGQFAYFDRPRDLLICGVSSYPTQLDALMTECLFALWRAVSAQVPQ